MHVSILTATPGHQMDDLASWSIQAAAANLRRHGHIVPDVEPFACIYVDLARNQLVNAALHQATADAVLFWDADQTIYCPPEDDLAALFDLGPIVTAAYVDRRRPRRYALWGRDDKGLRQLRRADLEGAVEPFEVALCGAGALWVRREVFERVPFPWFQQGYRPDGSYYGEDLHFIDQAHAAGYRVLCNPKICTGHLFQGTLVHRPPAVTPEQLTPGIDEQRRIAAGDAWMAVTEERP